MVFKVYFYLKNGTDIAEYKTLLDAVFGLFKTLLGDFDFEAMKARNAYLGPLLFITFEIVCYFIFLNMFLAILNKTYSDVVDNGVDDPMAVEFRSTVAQYWRQTKEFLMFWKRKDDLARYREDDKDDDEEEKEEEKKNALDGEALGMMLKTIQELSLTLRGLNEKVDSVSKVQALAGANTRLQTLNRGTVAVNRDSPPQRGAGPNRLESVEEDAQFAGAETEAVFPQSPISSPMQHVRAPSKLTGSYSSDTAAASAKPPPPSAIKTKSGKPILPPDWQAYQDDDGKTYYYNQVTKKTSWDPPTIVVPTKAGGDDGGGGDRPGFPVQDYDYDHKNLKETFAALGRARETEREDD